MTYFATLVVWFLLPGEHCFYSLGSMAHTLHSWGAWFLLSGEYDSCSHSWERGCCSLLLGGMAPALHSWEAWFLLFGEHGSCSHSWECGFCSHSRGAWFLLLRKHGFLNSRHAFVDFFNFLQHKACKVSSYSKQPWKQAAFSMVFFVNKLANVGRILLYAL